MIKKAFAWYLELVRTGVNRTAARSIAASYLDAARRPTKLEIMNAQRIVEAPFCVEMCGPCRFCGSMFRCPPGNPNADDCGRHGVPRTAPLAPHNAEVTA